MWRLFLYKLKKFFFFFFLFLFFVFGKTQIKNHTETKNKPMDNFISVNQKKRKIVRELAQIEIKMKELEDKTNENDEFNENLVLPSTPSTRTTVLSLLKKGANPNKQRIKRIKTQKKINIDLYHQPDISSSFLFNNKAYRSEKLLNDFFTILSFSILIFMPEALIDLIINYLFPFYYSVSYQLSFFVLNPFTSKPSSNPEKFFIWKQDSVYFHYVLESKQLWKYSLNTLNILNSDDESKKKEFTTTTQTNTKNESVRNSFHFFPTQIEIYRPELSFLNLDRFNNQKFGNNTESFWWICNNNILYQIKSQFSDAFMTLIIYGDLNIEPYPNQVPASITSPKQKFQYFHALLTIYLKFPSHYTKLLAEKMIDFLVDTDSFYVITSAIQCGFIHIFQNSNPFNYITTILIGEPSFVSIVCLTYSQRYLFVFYLISSDSEKSFLFQTMVRVRCQVLIYDKLNSFSLVKKDDVKTTSSSPPPSERKQQQQTELLLNVAYNDLNHFLYFIYTKHLEIGYFDSQKLAFQLIQNIPINRIVQNDKVCMEAYFLKPIAFGVNQEFYISISLKNKPTLYVIS